MIATTSLLAAGLTWAAIHLPADPTGPTGPEERPPSQGGFVHDPQVRVRLIASGPAVVAPVAIDWDAAGRAWVLNGDGSLVRLDEGGPVRLEEGLEGAAGFVFHRDGVLVAVPGRVLWIRDVDEDGERTEVVTLGEGLSLTDLEWGLDGRVYAIAQAPPGSKGGGIVRFQPADAQPELETIVALEGAVGLATSWDGQLFAATREAHFVHVVMPDSAFTAGRISRVSSWVDGADHSYLQRLTGRKGEQGAAFGVPGHPVALESPAWPPAYLGNYLVPEAEGGIVHRDLVSTWGVSFRAGRARKGEVLASDDPAFQPTAVELGPTGNVYVLDANGGEPGAGNVWELVYVGDDVPPFPPGPPLASLTTQELTYALSSPIRWRRFTAHRLLLERGVDAELGRELAKRSAEVDDRFLRLHTLWLASGESNHLRASIASFDPGVRRTALRVFRERSQVGRKVTAADVRSHVLDGDGRTRLEALRAWPRVIDGGSERELVSFYRGFSDDWSRSAAVAIARLRPDRFLKAVFLRGSEAEFHDIVTLLARDVANERDERDAVMMVLELPGGDRTPRLVAIVLREINAEMAEDAPWPSPRLASTLRRLASHENLGIASAALPLARAWLGDQLANRELAAWSERVLAVVSDEDRSLELRLSGFEALIDVPESRREALLVAGSFLDRTVWASAVLDALEHGRIGVEELGAERAELLQVHADAEVATRAARLLGE